MTISKSDYMLFLRHAAWLWVKKHRPELIPPVDAATQAIFDTGHAFEPWVEQLFDSNQMVKFSFDNYQQYKELPQLTQQAIEGGATTLIQPRFVWQDFTFLADIIEISGQNRMRLYEIKSSTGVSTDHLYDLAFQKAVLQNLGWQVESVWVIHVNNQYVRQGHIDPRQLCAMVEVTERVAELSDFTAQAMMEALSIAQSDNMPDPSPSLVKRGGKAAWLPIYANIVPTEPTIWPDTTQPTLDAPRIKHFLQQLQFPLYFFDYETMMSLVPYFDGHRPYQQIPFQYSLHIAKQAQADPSHVEYLHTSKTDPARAIAEQLLRDVGQSGSIITWNASFEKGINQQLAAMFPDLAEGLMAINERVVDLMTPFKSKWYDHPQFEGSASIKKVLPVLCPDLSYAELGIKDGNSAQRLWMQAVLENDPNLVASEVLQDLRTYCHMDTWAMVRIWRCLAELE